MQFRLNVCVSILTIFFSHNVQYSAGIIGGSDAEPGEFPYAVSLRNETNKHYCGGALVSRRHIVTAAHCLFTDQGALFYELEQMYDPSVIKAVIGSVYSEWLDGEYYQAKKLWPHPEFNITDSHSIFHDIGIVELLREVTNERIIPIGLPTQHVASGTMATVVGWGVDSRDNINKTIKIARVLQKADMEVMDPNACVHVYLEEIRKFAYTTEAIIAGVVFCCVHEHVNACYRDSGSPLIQNGELAGIVIFGNACQKGSPDIFTSTFSYIEFILDCVKGQCTSVRDAKQDLMEKSCIRTIHTNDSISICFFILFFLLLQTVEYVPFGV